MTPYEAMNGLKPIILFLQIFRCRLFIKNNHDQLIKFQPKSNESILLGYFAKSKSYHILNYHTHVIEESSDKTFDNNFIRFLERTHFRTHINEFDAPPPGSPYPQVIHEVDFESLFTPIETTLDLESRSRSSPTLPHLVSQTKFVSKTTFPLFYYEVFTS